MARAGCKLVEFVIEIWINILLTIFEWRKLKGPEVDSRKEVFAERPVASLSCRSRLVPAMSWKVLVIFIRTKRQKAFFFEGTKEHGLFIKAKLADFIEEKDALVGSAEEAGAVRGRAGVRTLLVAEEILEAVSPRSVAQLISTNGPSKLRSRLRRSKMRRASWKFSLAGWTHKEDGIRRACCNMLDFFYEPIEGCTFGFNTGFKTGEIVFVFAGEAAGECVVLGKIQIDEADLA